MKMSFGCRISRRAPALGACTVALFAGTAIGAQPTQSVGVDEDAPARRSSLVQRGVIGPINRNAVVPIELMPALFPFEIREIDGSNNNPLNPLLGTPGTPFIRLAPADYADGVGSPSGAGRPSAREVSNALAAQTGSFQNSIQASDYLWQWGQFLDHDIDETPVASPAEAFDISVPQGDQWFDPASSGSVVIPLDRSAGDTTGGVREQINNITAYIDASNVYGSEHDRAEWLRTNDGTGRLKTSDGDMLPFNTDALPNAPTANDPSFFLAGDIRASEQIGLAAMHALFVREHNFWASHFAESNPLMTGDELYEHARAIVVAEMQAITYNEFLPLLLGHDAMPPYIGWDPQVDPSISNEFATVAYRVGHTMLSPTLLRLHFNGDPITAGNIPLANAFFTPQTLLDTGLEPVLRGLAAQEAQSIDPEVIDAVRNFLFGPPGAGGFDLASLNIQRGRDHGIPSYNEVRAALGLSAMTSFDDMPMPADMRDKFESVYASVNHIDPWPGMLAEDHVPGSLLGETMHAIILDQFIRLRDGDRFWYETYLPPEMVQLVNEQTLARIIRRNTDIGVEIQANVFLAAPICAADVNGDGALSPADFTAWLIAFNKGDLAADQNNDGSVDPADFTAWLIGFNTGCE